MEAIVVHSGRSFGETFCQVLPSSLVICTVLSSVPTHSSPFLSGDSASACAKLTLYSDDHIDSKGCPGICCILSTRLRVMSGLIVSHELPSSVVRKTRLPAV
jgi:hypothetical protein